MWILIHLNGAASPVAAATYGVFTPVEFELWLDSGGLGISAVTNTVSLVTTLDRETALSLASGAAEEIEFLQIGFDYLFIKCFQQMQILLDGSFNAVLVELKEKIDKHA